MLVRKDNEIEIWTDTIEKGTAKKCFICAIIVIVFLLFLQLSLGLDYRIKETYNFIMFFVGVPSSLFIIAGLINLIKENKKSQLLLRINAEYIEILRKNKYKKILMGNLNRINKVSSNYGSVIVFFYIENNKECKYNLPISVVNKNLIEIAIKEYKKDLLISEII